MVSVWFIRHGESEANAGLPTIAQAVTPLTEKGHRQAQQVACSVPHPPCLIVTSPYLRTQQTAKPTIDRFSQVQQAEWRVQEFTYLATQHYHNTTEQYRHPLSDAYWERCDPFHVDGEGAESFADLMERVEEVRSKLSQLELEFITVFTHGRFMRALLWSVLTDSRKINARNMAQFWMFVKSISIPNGSILKMQFQGSEVWCGGISTAHLLEPDSQ